MNKNTTHSGFRRRGAVGVAVRDGRLLAIQRAAGVSKPGWWCFPGGTIESGESESQAVVREMQEELGLRVRTTERLWVNRTNWNVDLVWWQVELLSTEIDVNPLEVAAYDWLTVEQMRGLPKLLDSNHAFLDAWHEGDFSIAGMMI